jgi:hypothetical protein
LRRLNPSKLHVTLGDNVTEDHPVNSRSYTLTHSDTTGQLFLTIDTTYNKKQISGWYTRLMRDEVLAEWKREMVGPILHVYCHISGGLVLGNAGWRYAIFKRELPLVLEAFRYGDRMLYLSYPELDNAVIKVHFSSHHQRHRKVQNWGSPKDYQM